MSRSKKEVFKEGHYDFMDNRVLIIDGMNIAYTALYSHKRLSYKGKSTSMIYGVPQIIRPYVEEFKPHKVIIVWDGDKHPKRLEILPGYKSHREKKRDPEERKAFLKQIRRVQYGLYRLGICQVRNERVEGDDMIYKVVKKQPTNTWIRILSGDEDFFQLLRKGIDVLSPRTKYGMHYSILPISFPIKDHKQFLDSKVLLGDKSDDIPGYRGIGPVACRKFFHMYDSIQSFLDNPKSSFPGIDKEKLQKLYKKNRLLMDLAYFDKKYNSHEKIEYIRGKQFPQFNEIKWLKYCMKYNLKTLTTNQFIKIFNP